MATEAVISNGSGSNSFWGKNLTLSTMLQIGVVTVTTIGYLILTNSRSEQTARDLTSLKADVVELRTDLRQQLDASRKEWASGVSEIRVELRQLPEARYQLTSIAKDTTEFNIDIKALTARVTVLERDLGALTALTNARATAPPRSH